MRIFLLSCKYYSSVLDHFALVLMVKDILILYFFLNFTNSQLQLETQSKLSIRILSQVFKLRYWREQSRLKLPLFSVHAFKMEKKTDMT